MPLRDVLYLIVKPFLGNKRGPTKNEVLSRAVEHGAAKDAAARLTQTEDGGLKRVRADRRPNVAAYRHKRRAPAAPTGIAARLGLTSVPSPPLYSEKAPGRIVCRLQ